MPKKILFYFFSLFLLFLVLPSNAEAAVFPHIKTAVCENWAVGTSEFWHLIPINEKTTFKSGERIQFFAQGGPVFEAHSWTVKVYKGNEIYHQLKSQAVYPPSTGWNYSNYTPYLASLPIGDYWVHYFVNMRGREIPVNGTGFKVIAGDKNYTFHHAVAATGYKHGTGEAYWDLNPTGQNIIFLPGQTIYLNAQVRDIIVNHQHKAELFRDNHKIFEHTTDWQNVGSGWTFGNFNPYYKNIASGNYVYKYYINTGKGFEKLADVPFSVQGSAEKYSYHHTYIAKSWKHGSGEKYWDLLPVDQKTVFAKGDSVYALSQIRNIKVDHRWKVELYKSGAKQWEYATAWNKVDSNWEYGNFTPHNSNSAVGSYEFKIYIDTDKGFMLLDKKSFSVK